MDRTTLKSWFQRGKKPTASQFAALIDSFWHKDDTMSLHSIKGLNEALQTKAGINHDHDEVYSATGHTHDQYLTEHQDITGKADKVVGAVAGNLATLDANGNPIDSGKKTADFAPAEHNHDEVYSAIGHTHDQYLTEHQDISGKQDKTDTTLQTADKTVVGAINEVDSNLKKHLDEYDGLSQLVMGLEEQTHNHLTTDFPALKSEVESLKQQSSETVPSVAPNLVVSTTYSELKALRDSAGLSVGTWYRITDYETTVYNNANARAAGHPFDILVLATDVNQLSEDAKAVHSARDTEGYFAHANLGAWKLKYSLDNDTTKFAWASEGGEKWTTTLPEIGMLELTPVSTNDTTHEGCPYKFTGSVQGMSVTLYVAHLELQEGEDFIPNVIVVDGGEPMVNQMPITAIVHENQTAGKGVVWEMEDEFNNLCSYDFKNIQFKRSLITSTLESPSEEECAFYGKYVGQALEELPALPEGYAIDPNDSKYLYTFSVIAADGTVEDNSMGVDLTSAGMGIIHLCALNRMRENVNASSFALDLNNNVFVATCNSADEMMNLIVIGNTFGTLCMGNTFVNATIENTFGNSCYYNSFGNNCYSNSFGNDCYGNSFGNYFQNNSFGNSCDSNTFGNDCDYNSFGNNCYRNSFGNNCYSNSFGNYCYYNSFGNNCYSNSFGNYFQNNSFGNDCYGNSFGNDCDYNSFGNSCDSNTFGNNCYRNSFGNDCYGNSFGNGCQYNNILDNVQYITAFEGVRYVSIGSTSGTVQYAQVLNGTCGSSSSNMLQIDFAVGKSYTQIAGKNSAGELKIWVPADMVATA